MDKTLLLVEDNPGDARLIKEMIGVGRNQFNMDHAENLQQAIRHIQDNSYDAALLDLNLPDSSGLDTVRSFASCTEDIPIIILTSLDEDELGNAAIMAGAQDYLCKQDITNRSLQRSLHYAEGRLSQIRRVRSIIENNADPTLVISDTGEIHFSNKAAREMFSEQLEAGTAGEINTLLRAVARGELDDITLALGDGQPHDFEVHKSRCDWGVGEDTYIVVLHDVTDHKKIQKLLVDDNEQLEEKVAERTTSLINTNRALHTLSACNRALIHIDDELKLLEEVCRIIVDIGKHRFAWVDFTNNDDEKVTSKIWAVEEGEKLETITAQWDENINHNDIIGKAVNTGKVVVVSDTPQGKPVKQQSDEEQQGRSRDIATIPLKRDDKVFGVLCISASVAGAFDDDEIELLTELADDLAFGIVTLREREEKKRGEQELRKLGVVVEQSPNGVMITNPLGVIEYVNPAYETMTGYTASELVGSKPNIVGSGIEPEETYTELWHTISNGGVYRNILLNRRKDGTNYYEEKTISPLKDDDGKISHYISTGLDITEKLKAEEKIQYLVNYDHVTGLPNQNLFKDRLQQAIARAQWHNRVIAVLILDLYNFSTINESIGHAGGDELLQQVAERLRKAVRDGDTVARLTGDTYAILLEDMAQADDMSALASQLLEALDDSYHVADRTIYITASIGIACYPDDGNSPEDLIKNADTALNRAKVRGQGIFQYYKKEFEEQSTRRLLIDADLRKALERDEFMLFYQPKVDMVNGHISGVEALIRWQHPQHGIVSPLEFIPLLEANNLIIPVGEWVLREACEQHIRWREAGLPPLIMAVNLSPKQLEQDNLASTINVVLAETGMDPDYLELELTESMLIQDVSRTEAFIGEVKQMGIDLAIDDFGTGYSSLSYLTRFPVDTLKIDRAFITNLPDNEQDVEVARAIIALAHGLDMAVVAEGVETDAHLEFLRQHDCDLIQGYYFSPPVAADKLAELFNGFQDSRIEKLHKQNS